MIAPKGRLSWFSKCQEVARNKKCFIFQGGSQAFIVTGKNQIRNDDFCMHYSRNFKTLRKVKCEDNKEQVWIFKKEVSNKYLRQRSSLIVTLGWHAPARKLRGSERQPNSWSGVLHIYECTTYLHNHTRYSIKKPNVSGNPLISCSAVRLPFRPSTYGREHVSSCGTSDTLDDS